MHLSVSQGDPHQTVQILINLVERHEQAFYSFVHKVQTKGEDLFDSLMHWIELFLTLTRDGFGQAVSLEFILPHTGTERELIMKEVDDVALYHYKLKLFYEEKLRRRFGRAHSGRTDADADDAIAQELVDGVVKELSFGELVKGDANDIAAGESSDSDDSSESSEEDSSDEDGEEGDDDTSGGEPTPKPSRHVSKEPRDRQARSTKPSAVNNTTRSQSRPNDFRNRPMYQPQPQPPMQLPGTSPRPRLRPSKSFSGSPVTSPLRSTSNVPLPEKSLPAVPGASHSRNTLSVDDPRITRTGSATRRRPSPNGEKRKRKKAGVATLEPPQLVHIPKLLPLFLEMVSISTTLKRYRV